MSPRKKHSQTRVQADAHPELTDSCFSKSICSSTDCTGLIPAMPSAEAELEAYEEMYQFCLDAASAKDPEQHSTDSMSFPASGVDM